MRDRGPGFKDVADQDVYAGDWVFWVPSGSGRLCIREIVKVERLEGKAPGHGVKVTACRPQDRDRAATHRQISPGAVGLYRTRG